MRTVPVDTAEPQQQGKRALRGIAALGLVLAVAWVFHGAIEGEFLSWDDDLNLTSNPHLHPLSGENLRWMLTDTAWMRRYVPLAWLGWGVEQAIWGLNSRAAHVINVGFHAANTCLVFVLLHLLVLRDAPTRRGAGAAAAGWAFLLTLLWALHPLRVEPVAWASGRLYLQATFFALLAVLAYLRSQTSVSQPADRWRIAAVVFYAASLLTYPIALGLPAVLALINLKVTGHLDGSSRPWASGQIRRLAREQLPFLAVAGLALGVTLWSRATVTGIWLGTTAGPLDAETLVHRLLRGTYHLLQVLWKPFVPFNLSPVYTDLIDPNPWTWSYLASAGIVGGVTLAVIRWAGRYPALLAIWLCHLVFLLPYLGLTEATHYPNDRYTYLHAILVLGVAATLETSRVARIAGPALALGAVALGIFAVRQIPVWRNDETLFRHALASVGDHYYRGDLTWRLANALNRGGRTEEARHWFEETLRVARGNTSKAAAHHGLGVLALGDGNDATALMHWQSAMNLDPTQALYHQWTAFLLLRAGRIDEAAAVIQRGLSFDPANPELRRYQTGVLQLRGTPANPTR